MILPTNQRLFSVVFVIFSFFSFSQTNAGSDETICHLESPYTLFGFSPAGGTWSGTDVSPSGVFTPSATGAYVLTYTQGGNSDTKTVTVNQPVSSFVLNPSIGCAIPHTVFFTDQSTLPDTWFWDFGDANTSTVQNPVHNYTTSGSFVVTLTVTDTINGCSSVSTDTVEVDIASANFNISPAFGCGPLTVNFSDASTVSGSTVDSWSWDFGDGATSTQASPTHVYDTPGIYTPIMTITTPSGCTSTHSVPAGVQVIGPDVNFGGDALTSDCFPLSVNFTDSTIFGAPITSWTWDFGDGNGSNVQNPSYEYTVGGSFDVSLAITDIDGCSRTLVFPDYVVIEDVIPPSITCPTDLTLPTDVGVCSLSSPSIGMAVATDNCTIASTVNDLPVTLFPGVTNVTWTTTDDTGLTATCVQSITVLDESTSSTIAESACDTYTAPSGAILTSTGSYLDVIPNAAGCDSNITINLDLNFSFLNSVTDVGCGGSYTSGSGQTYTTSGTYTELLTTVGGCDSTITLIISVEDLDATITQNETTLTTNWTGAESYQWIDCSDNSIIVGATNTTYVTFANGDYAVIVPSPNCTDTSACTTVNSAFLDELEANPIFLYPNPTSGGETKVFFDGTIRAINVIDVFGRIVDVPVDLEAGKISTSDLKSGNYIVRVKTESGIYIVDMMITQM